MSHKPVLLNEVIEYLNPQVGQTFIDATLNGGGHALALLEKVGPTGKVIGIEWDSKLVKEFKDAPKNLTIVNDSYTNLEKIVTKNDIVPDGIIFDLGLSSWHYEASGRGFSFQNPDEPLDMRFNPNKGKPASEIINIVSVVELERILNEYGEEQFAKSIAQTIVQARKVKPILKVGDLVAVVEASVPNWYRRRKINPATKTFQAFRIAVNHELENVTAGVEAAIKVLRPGGRLVVISFQGLEDKIVREIFKKHTKEGIISWVKKGTIRPVWEEIKTNPRSRSAKMKVVEKCLNT